MRTNHRPLLRRAILPIATFLGGAVFGSIATSERPAAPEMAAETAAETALQVAPPGYLIGITRTATSDPNALAAYGRAAGPLAAAAGMSYLARGPAVHVLEGEWPFEGSFMIEQYTSLQSILDFWYSPGYQEAKKLREGLVDIDFLIAVEGLAP